jgi:hypothetical protein
VTSPTIQACSPDCSAAAAAVAALEQSGEQAWIVGEVTQDAEQSVVIDSAAEAAT